MVLRMNIKLLSIGLAWFLSASVTHAQANMIEIATAETASRTDILTVHSQAPDGSSLEAIPVVYSTDEASGRLTARPLQETETGEFLPAITADGEPLFWYLGIQMGTGLVASARVGLLFPMADSGYCGGGLVGTCNGHGITAEVEVGLGGARVGVGYGILGGVDTGSSIPVPILGARAGASVLFSWLDDGPAFFTDDAGSIAPGSVEDAMNVTAPSLYAGGEASFTFLVMNFTVGAYARIAGDSPSDDFLIRLSGGFGF